MGDVISHLTRNAEVRVNTAKSLKAVGRPPVDRGWTK
jgi:hypothetical protein